MNLAFFRIDFWLAFSFLTAGLLSLSVGGQETTDRNAPPLPKHAQIAALAVSPDGKILASASYEGIDLWDLATGNKRARYPDGLGYCSLAFADDGETLITVDWEGNLRYRESASGKIRHEFALSKGADKWDYENCSMTRNGRFLAMPNSMSKTLCVWDLTARRELMRIKLDLIPISISEDGRYLGGEPKDKPHGSLEVWEIVNSKLVRSFDNSEQGYVISVGFSPDGKTLMSSGNHAHGTRSWDIDTGKLRMAYGSSPPSTYEFAYSDDGKRLATLQWDENRYWLCVWDFAAGTKLWRRPVLAFSDPAIVFTPDGKTLITAGRGDHANIRLWDVRTGSETRTLE